MIAMRLRALWGFLVLGLLGLSFPAGSELEGHWKLDEASGQVAGDASGKNRSGALSGATNWVPGRVGKALSLDGASGFVRIKRDAALEVPAITVALWLKRSGEQGPWANVARKTYQNNNAPTFASWGLQLNPEGAGSGVLAFNTGYAGGIQHLRAPSGAVPDESWVHVAAVYDPAAKESQKRLYIDGDVVAAAAETRPISYDASESGDIYFGQNGAGKEFFKGAISDVRLYARALSAEEVRALAKGSAGATAAESPVARPARRGEFQPGALSEPEKKKRFDELSGRGRDPKAAAKAAASKRQKRLEELEKSTGIYDIATIVDNGDSAKRVDIVIVSAGFPKSEQAKVNQMAESLKTGLLKVDPFRNYPLYINFHRINVNDANPASARIPYRVANNILTCDVQKAIEYAERAPAADLAVILCNTPPCRSTASGPVITIDASLDMGRTFLHEMGHAFGRLLDEYIEPGNEGKARSPAFSAEQEEAIVNVTMVSNARVSKWHYWMPDVWNTAYVQNRLPPQHKVGCQEGAGLFGKGTYRPEESCLMRTGEHYCVVCFEQVEKQFYHLIAPIDDARPREARVGLFIDDGVTFEGDAITTSGAGKQFGEFRAFWYVDGKSRRNSEAKNLTTKLAVQASELGEGAHEVALRVEFSNQRVRRDNGWLSATRSWLVDVSKHKRPKFEAPGDVKGQVGKAIEFDVKVDNPNPAKYALKVLDSPEGAEFKEGKFRWTPAVSGQGAWRPRFILSDGVRSVRKDVDIAVFNPASKGSFKPVFIPQDTIAVIAGEALDLALDVADVDGDNLVFSSTALPPGAELDPYGGKIRWRPSFRDLGRHTIPIEVSDGVFRVKGTIEVMVEEQFDGRKVEPDVLQLLRSPYPKWHVDGLKKLSSFGKMFQILETARILRDRFKSVRAAALEQLKALVKDADDAHLGMLAKDIVPHAWDFTDDPEILAWLSEFAAQGKGERSDLDALKGALRVIERYNKERGATK
jgi:hypothetical protein